MTRRPVRPRPVVDGFIRWAVGIVLWFAAFTVGGYFGAHPTLGDELTVICAWCGLTWAVDRRRS